MTVEKPNLKGLPGGASDEMWPWERPNLRSVLGTDKEGKKSKLEGRITAAQENAINRVLDQKLLPEIQTRSDIVNGSLGLFLAYVKKRTQDPELHKIVNLAMWEAEITAIEEYEKKITGMLDRLEQELHSARACNQKQKFMRAYASLSRNKDGIEDEGLMARAKKLWVLHHDFAKECGKG